MPGINNVLSALEAHYRGQVNGHTIGFVSGVASLVAAHPTTSVLSGDVLAASANCGGCTALGCGGDGVDLAALLGDDTAAANAAENIEPKGARKYAALVIIGGAAAVRAATVLANLKGSTPIIVLPATIANDVGCGVEVALGFDSAGRTAAQLVGNMATDCNSAKKYWQMITVVGCVKRAHASSPSVLPRAASHSVRCSALPSLFLSFSLSLSFSLLLSCSLSFFRWCAPASCSPNSQTHEHTTHCTPLSSLARSPARLPLPSTSPAPYAATLPCRPRWCSRLRYSARRTLRCSLSPMRLSRETSAPLPISSSRGELRTRTLESSSLLTRSSRR